MKCEYRRVVVAQSYKRGVMEKFTMPRSLLRGEARMVIHWRRIKPVSRENGARAGEKKFNSLEQWVYTCQFACVCLISISSGTTSILSVKGLFMVFDRRILMVDTING
jgi:hypothetical protein